MNKIEPGTPVVAADVDTPDDWAIHRWSHREDTGLGVTMCGKRQGHRGNGWALEKDALPSFVADLQRCDRCYQ